MSKKQDFDTQDYHIQCLGIDQWGFAVLDEPVDAKVSITRRAGGNNLSAFVNCEYNFGGHGERCKASHPDTYKADEDVLCPYSTFLERQLITLNGKINNVISEEGRAILEENKRIEENVSSLTDHFEGKQKTWEDPAHLHLRAYVMENYNLLEKASKLGNSHLFEIVNKSASIATGALRFYYDDLMDLPRIRFDHSKKQE